MEVLSQSPCRSLRYVTPFLGQAKNDNHTATMFVHLLSVRLKMSTDSGSDTACSATFASNKFTYRSLGTRSDINEGGRCSWFSQLHKTPGGLLSKRLGSR